MTPNRSSDDGFTLVELLVTTLLVGIVTLVLFATSESLTRVAATTQVRSQSLADARTGIERIARDLRAANPIDAVSGPISQYDASMSFSVYCATGSAGCTNNLRPIRYSLAGFVLTQTTPTVSTALVGPAGTPTLTPTLRRGAVLNTTTNPVFTYYRRDGTRISTGADAPPATYFRDCTKSVKIHLIVRSEPNKSDRIVELVTTVNLRNYNEVNPC